MPRPKPKKYFAYRRNIIPNNKEQIQLELKRAISSNVQDENTIKEIIDLLKIKTSIFLDNVHTLEAPTDKQVVAMCKDIYTKANDWIKYLKNIDTRTKHLLLFKLRFISQNLSFELLADELNSLAKSAKYYSEHYFPTIELKKRNLYDKEITTFKRKEIQRLREQWVYEIIQILQRHNFKISASRNLENEKSLNLGKRKGYLLVAILNLLLELNSISPFRFIKHISEAKKRLKII